jgi:hypothetical protein
VLWRKNHSTLLTMKTLPLTRGRVAIIDDADYEALSQFKWCYSGGDSGYAVRRVSKAEGGRIVYLHRLIAKAQEGEVVDHINRDKMDNTRANLRLVTAQHNVINRPIHKRNKTGIKGVYMSPFGKYVVNMSLNNRTKYLGTFDTLDQAEACRAAACEKFYGVYYKN